MADNQRKCEDSSEYIIFTTRTEIRSLSLTPKSTTVQFKPIGGLTNVVGVDFDYKDNKIVYTQIRPDTKITVLSGDFSSAGDGDTILDKGGQDTR